MEVIATDEWLGWFRGLDDRDAKSVARAVDILERRGTSLGSPQSSQLKGTRFALRELRVQSGGKPLRIIYAFDPARDAVLIIGGDKTGDGRFYTRTIAEAERIWEQYLNEQGAKP